MVKSVANPTYKPIAHHGQPFQSFNEFYPFYLGHHTRRIHRIFHLAGTTIALACHTRLILSLFPFIAHQLSIPVGPQTLHVLRRLQLSPGNAVMIFLTGLMAGDLLASIRGRSSVDESYIPPSFKYHIFALRGDLRMLWEVITVQRSI